MTEYQRKTALRLARVPAYLFKQMVERPKPPTVVAILGECQFEDLGADPEVTDSGTQSYPK